jgi:catechol 2,3-dioxygenase-like lactoylglutathione lyase family enzyme
MSDADSRTDMPMPKEGINVTQLLIVRDLERSRHFYTEILGGKVLKDGVPTILGFHDTWLILSTEGPATDDRPGVEARAPENAPTFSSALNLRVSDVQAFYKRWRSRGAEFLTPPKEHKSEIRCYMRDPDGRLIEVGQAKQEG